VADANGHGTFVASLAAAFGGGAQLLIVKAGGISGNVTSADEAAAIRYAVDAGAEIINLSLAGATTSATERKAIRYASDRGALLIAAVGNERLRGNPVEYPAALLQPLGSNGRGGIGLAVAASTRGGTSAVFSNTGSWVSLAAPGDAVFGALSALSSPLAWPRVPLPGGTSGLYGYASGSSFAAPEVAGAAALVWSVNNRLTAAQVAQILKDTASGHGKWTPDVGWGVIDVASAVSRAQLMP
jgi:subtilisin family serine protease